MANGDQTRATGWSGIPGVRVGHKYIINPVVIEFKALLIKDFFHYRYHKNEL